MSILDGKAIAQELRTEVAREVSRLKTEHDLEVGLAVVLVGEDPASEIYVRNKNRQSLEAGIASFEHKMSSDTRQADLLAKIEALNSDSDVHGILVQLPLPDHLDESEVLKAIRPEKDVDGFHPVNVGLLTAGSDEGLVPCTPFGCVALIKKALGDDLSGKNAVIIGRSNIVGKPMASLLLKESCTVTIAHSRTVNLPDLCRTADILVAAVGRAEMVKGDWIKPGATLIDVGINRIDKPEGGSKLLGDVDFAEAAVKAGAITPVPGGVGPMTIACLLRNAVVAACHQNQVDTGL